ncbi:hypothetical protein ANCCAN_11277 [Ancylostoma caninum]|uniref:Uncharacterized protein n=1 Tax=Ancylostoma caninum TaxID=29170 RepID=A0A368GHK3_ANCCA|nr:hypothetical protein ANCCAN_11277 [Ancylostoma caninum]
MSEGENSAAVTAQDVGDDRSIASDDSVTIFDTSTPASAQEAAAEIINPSQNLSCKTRIGAKAENNVKRRREDELLETLGTIAKQLSTSNNEVSLNSGDEWDLLGGTLAVRLRELAQLSIIKARRRRLEVDKVLLAIAEDTLFEQESN